MFPWVNTFEKNAAYNISSLEHQKLWDILQFKKVLLQLFPRYIWLKSFSFCLWCTNSLNTYRLGELDFFFNKFVLFLDFLGGSSGK